LQVEFDVLERLGATSKWAVSGRCGIRSRRQPAMSGTSTFRPKWSSGSSKIRHHDVGDVDQIVARRFTIERRDSRHRRHLSIVLLQD